MPPIITETYERVMSVLDHFLRGSEDFERAKAVVPFVYYLLFFIAFTRLEGLDQIIARGAGGFDPRWPLLWAHSLDISIAATVVYVGMTMASFVACIFPYSMLARTFAFLGMLEFHAYMSSFGGPNHQWDHWLWILFILIFLPSRKRTDASQDSRRTFSLVFWGAQAFLLMTYSMAGLQKITYGFIQMAEGQANAFSMNAGALHIAHELLEMGQTTLLGPFIIYHPWIGWLPFFAVLYLQFFAIYAAFHPTLHRLWGLGLILFHIGTFLTMRAVFTAPSGLLLVLLLSSPFAQSGNSLREIVRSLPLVGLATRLSQSMARKIAARAGVTRAESRDHA